MRYSQFKKNAKNADLENEDRDLAVEERALHHSTGNVQIYICVLFTSLGTGQHTFRQKPDTYTHIHNERQGC